MKKIIAVFLMVIFSSNYLFAQQNDNRYLEQLNPLIEKVLREQSIPGFAIGLVKNQKVVYSAAFGVANINEPQRKITTRSLFHMASVTKPFVATSILQLVEKGKINLDDPVVKYLPYFSLQDKRYPKITVRQMLNHSSGMPDTDDYGWDKPQFDDGALERYVRSLNNLKLKSEPGTKFAYSNIAYEVLGDLIAKVSGETFENYVQKNILQPLGMKNSTLLLKQTDPTLLTSPHVFGNSRRITVSKVFPYNRMHSASGTLCSNIDDMTRWAIANLNYGELDGQRILEKSTYDLMWKPTEKISSDIGKIGISWFLGEYRNHKMVFHAGGDTGFNSLILLIPDEALGLVVMTNFDGGFNVLNAITKASLDTALGFKPEPIVIKTSFANIIDQTIPEQGANEILLFSH